MANHDKPFIRIMLAQFIESTEQGSEGNFRSQLKKVRLRKLRILRTKYLHPVNMSVQNRYIPT